jgi:hypothetical protein
MHNLDRTQLEREFEDDYGSGQHRGFQHEEEYFGEFETDDGYDDEAGWGFEAEAVAIPGSPFDEAEEMDLAAELVEVLENADDDELEQFLGRIVRRAGRGLRRAGRAVRRAVRSPVGRRIARGVRGIVRRALPVVGGALGGPAGAAAASTAGQVLGLELEGLSPEDQQFEVARQIVRLTGEAASMAAAVPENIDDAEAAATALRMSSRKHAPGLGPGGRTQTGERSGRWIRRGKTIVLMGV